jgi:hypothetical protein
MQNKASVVIGLSGRNLKDLDFFSKSDPYVVISRQTQPGGAFVALRKSETINNNLNPDWKDFLIYESELGNGTNDDIEIEVFDDDGKPGRDRNDQSIGFIKTCVSRLKAGETFEICSRKKGGVTGKVMVRTLRRNPGAESQPTNQAGNYAMASSSQSSGYPTAGGGAYPAPANSGNQGGGGYPPPANYQPAPGVYPTLPQGGAPGTGYPGAPAMVGYPGGGYPAQGGGYPAQGAVYPPVPPPASATLPYPVQPGPGMVHLGQQPSPRPNPGQGNSGRKNSQGLISQMAETVRPANPGGAGGFRLP